MKRDPKSELRARPIVVIGAESPRPVLAVPAFWREGTRTQERDLFGGVGDLPLFAVASYKTEGAAI